MGAFNIKYRRFCLSIMVLMKELFELSYSPEEVGYILIKNIWEICSI